MTPEAIEQATGMAKRVHFPTVLPVAKAQQGLQVLRSHSEALAVLPIQSFLPKALPLPHLVVGGGGAAVSGAHPLEQTVPRGQWYRLGPMPQGVSWYY